MPGAANTGRGDKQNACDDCSLRCKNAFATEHGVRRVVVGYKTIMDHIRKLAVKIWGGMRTKEKKDPRFLPPKKPVEYKGLSFEEAKEILGERFDGSPEVWYLLNMAVKQNGKEYVRKHIKGFRQAGLGSAIFFDD